MYLFYMIFSDMKVMANIYLDVVDDKFLLALWTMVLGIYLVIVDICPQNICGNYDK